MTEKLTTKMQREIRDFMYERRYTDPHEILYMGAILSIQALNSLLNDIEEKLQSKEFSEEMVPTNFIYDAHAAKKLMNKFAVYLDPILNKKTLEFIQKMMNEICDCDNCKEENCELRKHKEKYNDK